MDAEVYNGKLSTFLQEIAKVDEARKMCPMLIKKHASQNSTKFNVPWTTAMI